MLGSEESQIQILNTKLSEVASKLNYSPRAVGVNEQLNFISQKSTNWLMLEEAYIERSKRAMYFGDSHGLIFPMLDRARQRGLISLPIVNGIVNADYHADVAEYTHQTYNHSATWERYGVKNSFWDNRSAYNFRPHNSAFSHLLSILSNFSSSIDLGGARNIHPEILSVDIDFFNDIEIGSIDYENYLSVLEDMASNAKVVMLFSSSVFINDPIKGSPRQSIGQLNDITSRLQKAFISAL